MARLNPSASPGAAGLSLEPLRQPLAGVGDLVAGLVHALAELAEDRAEALRVERRRVPGLLAWLGLVAPLAVFARHDAVIVPGADPLHDLRHAPDRERVRLEQLHPEAAQLVLAGLPALILAGLSHDRVMPQLARVRPEGDRNQRLARYHRAAVDQGGRAV